jgi:outer membrane receptor protein involved in Fe transport
MNPDGTAFRPTAAFDAFNFNPFNIFQTPFQRFNIYTAGQYEVLDGIEVYGRGMFSRNTVETIIAPSGAFGLGVTVNLNNPYLTAAQRNAFCGLDTNTGVGYVPLIPQAACDAAANPTLRPGDAAYRTVNTTLFRRSVEAGPRTSEFVTTFYDFNAGLRGDITADIGWDVSGSYGESENVQTQGGYLLNSRTRQSLLARRDAGGNIVCIDPSNGCVAADFFGPGGALTPDAVGFLAGASSLVQTRTALTQARAQIIGSAPVTAPWAANSASFAVGAEFRDYFASQESDLLSRSGDLGGAGGAAPNITGSYNVWELLGEVQIPLVQDRDFFQDLTVGGGLRWSNYTIGAPGSPTYDTLTWKAEGTWEPVTGLRVRGNYSKASRAPNIAELFSPLNTVLTNLGDDPCANLTDQGLPIAGRPIPTGTLRDVCIAQGANPAIIGQIGVPTAGQANTTTGGNVFLEPEQSTSWTVGAVVNPQRLPGFSASVDYYSIVITDAISTPTPGDAIEACFGAGNLSVSNPACVGPTGIGRNFDTGQLSGDPATTRGLFLGLSNLGRLETSGIDFKIDYAREIGTVGLSLSVSGNWTERLKFQSTPSDVNRECIGFVSPNCGSITPEFSMYNRITVSWRNIDFSMLHRYLSSAEQEPLDVIDSGPFFEGTLTQGPLAGREVNFGEIPAYNYFDFSVGFNLTENLNVGLLINNITDKEPPLVGSEAGSTAFNSGNTFPSTYDALGRRYSVTARLRF